MHLQVWTSENAARSNHLIPARNSRDLQRAIQSRMGRKINHKINSDYPCHRRELLCGTFIRRCLTTILCQSAADEFTGMKLSTNSTVPILVFVDASDQSKSIANVLKLSRARSSRKNAWTWVERVYVWNMCVFERVAIALKPSPGQLFVPLCICRPNHRRNKEYMNKCVQRPAVERNETDVTPWHAR